jgi:hypothetical protein
MTACSSAIAKHSTAASVSQREGGFMWFRDQEEEQEVPSRCLATPRL